ncbi:MAG: OmpA family protein [Granulosicoccus sp.]
MSIKMRTSTTLAAGMLLYVLVPTHALSVEGSWHAGVNAGVSLLSPETEGSGFTLDNDQSTAASVYLGLDITSIISAEIAFTDLGEAELSQNETIEYEAFSIGAIAYVLGEREATYRMEGASAFLRLGLSVIENEADIELDESDNTAVWLGAGVQFPLSDHWGLRAEVASYDGDAQAIMAGIFWRIGGNRNYESQTSVAAEPEPKVEPQTTVESDVGAESDAVVTAVPAPVPNQAITERLAQPDVVDIKPECPEAAAATISDPEDCNLFNSVVAGLDFVGNTADITTQGSATLDTVVAVMKNYPQLILEIRAHTQALGDTQLEAQLSAQRAKAVARYLVQNGIPVSQLRAKAFGATRPLAVDGTFNGRRDNNRVEFKSIQ